VAFSTTADGSMKGKPVLCRSLTIAMLGGLVASGVAALPAQAGTTTAAHTDQHQVAPSRPFGLRPAPRQLAAHQAVALALARERALSGHLNAQTAAAAIATGIRAADSGAAHQRASMLTGVVRGLGGRPLAGACITATGPLGTIVARSRTDGRYVLAGLSPGQYSLRASDCATTGAPTATTWPGLPARVTVGSAQVRTLPPVSVLPASAGMIQAGSAGNQAGTGSISGRVTGGGHPLQGICAEADRVGGGSGRGAVTSKTGKYRITGLQPGRYQVQFTTAFGCGNKGNWLDQWYSGITTPFLTSKATVIRVRAGTTKTGIDARMKLGGAISGTVRTRSGELLPGICVEVEGRVRGGFVGYGFPSATGGRYVLHGVFPGRYTVGFSIGCGNQGNYAPQWWRLRTSGSRATPIEIKGTKVARNIDAALDPGAGISGTIKALNAAGKPLAGICVETSSTSAISGKDGTYQLKGLAGGRYLVVFDPSCEGNRSSNYLAQHRRVSVGRGQSLTGVNAYLQPGAGVTGVVTDAHGHPLQGVCIRITNGHGNAFAESGQDGSYSIVGLPADSFIVEFRGGCGNAASLAPQYYKNESGLGSADPITLVAGKVLTGIDAAMTPGATITGVVTDAAGHRLNNICVGIADESLLFFGDLFNDIENTRSGIYRVRNLAPGHYQVDFGCGGGKYADHWYRTKAGAFPSSVLSIPVGVTSGVSAVLRLSGAISGVVKNRAGQLVSNTCLYMVDAKTGAQVLSSVFQGFVENGQYKVTGLAPGTYKVFFYGCGTKYASQWYHGRSTERGADPVRVRTGQTTAGIGAVLAVGGSISGQVVAHATGKPVRNVCVEAFNAPSQAFGFAETDKTGHYTMRGLATGRYSVSFSPCYAKGPNLAGLTRVGLVRVTAPHALTGINARLAPGGNVSGKVTGGSHPQTGTCVELVPLSPNGTFGFGGTGIDGTYTATGLSAGQYQVFFNDPTCPFTSSQFAAQWYNGQPTQVTAGIITVAPGKTTPGIDAALQPFGQITGTVTGPANAPVAGECVTAIPVGRGFAGFYPPDIAITTKTGSYSLLDLQPGRYKVKFSTGCGDSGFRTQWWKNAGSAATATVITVGAGAVVTGIDAALKR
jgi:Carboxypeptidase regulatory-like domain